MSLPISTIPALQLELANFLLLVESSKIQHFYLSIEYQVMQHATRGKTLGKERICKLVSCKSSLNIFFRILKVFSTTFL
jgi:hypothetical protein